MAMIMKVSLLEEQVKALQREVEMLKHFIYVKFGEEFNQFIVTTGPPHPPSSLSSVPSWGMKKRDNQDYAHGNNNNNEGRVTAVGSGTRPTFVIPNVLNAASLKKNTFPKSIPLSSSNNSNIDLRRNKRCSVKRRRNIDDTMFLSHGARPTKWNGKKRKGVETYAAENVDFTSRSIICNGQLVKVLVCRFCRRSIGARSDRIREHLASKRHQKLKLETHRDAVENGRDLNQENSDDAVSAILPKPPTTKLKYPGKPLVHRLGKATPSIIHRVNENKKECPVCRNFFSAGKELDDHVMKHMEAHNIWPKIIQPTLPRDSEVSTNGVVKNREDVAILHCQYCNQRFESYPKLRSHLFSTHKNLMLFKCVHKDCVGSFIELEGLIDHMTTHGNENQTQHR